MQRIAGAIEIVDNAITNCPELLDSIASIAEWNDAKVGPTDGCINKEMRDNSNYFIHPFSFRTPEILYRFAKTVWEFIDDYGLRYDQGFSNLEPININRYLPGQRYRVHADAGPDKHRVISALVYLNDVSEGGETYFPHFDVSIRPEAGRLVIFPSNYAYAHAAIAPVSGVKYSAAFWTLA